MKTVKLTLALIGNTVIIAVAAYALGYHQGVNTPTVDQEAIERAVFAAMMED